MDESSVNLPSIQKLLKAESPEFEDELEKLHQEVQRLKSELVVSVKMNFAQEREISSLESKISLLIRNRITAEDAAKDGSNISAEAATSLERQLHSLMPLYGNLFYLLQKEPMYLAKLTRLARQADVVDSLLQTVVFTLYGDEDREENLLLSLFKLVLEDEFKECTDIAQFMRANSAFTKMLTSFSRRPRYLRYLKAVIVEPLELLLAQENLSLEINPSKIHQKLIEEYKQSHGGAYSGPTGLDETEALKLPEVAKIFNERVGMFLRFASMFVDRIFASTEKMPYGLRYVCKKIWELGRVRFSRARPSEVKSLVGGFIFLRFINPALISADTPHFQLITKKMTDQQRKNCTMICKFLQNLSNGLTFGDKEQHMIALNELLANCLPRCDAFFTDICNVGELADRLEEDSLVEFTGARECSINISVNETFLVHQLCMQNIDALAPAAEDPLRVIARDLAARGPPPSPVPAASNTFFTLRLVDRFRSDTAVDSQENGSHVMYNDLKKRLCNVLKILPSLPRAVKGKPISLVEVLKASKDYAVQKEEFQMAEDIKKIFSLIKILTEDGTIPVVHGSEEYTALLSDIQMDMDRRAQRHRELGAKLETMRRASEDVRRRHQYLTEQADAYRRYLTNAREKAFQPKPGKNHGSGVPQMVGPFSFKFTQLQADGIISQSGLQQIIANRTTVSFSSVTPGVFIVSVGAGVKGLDVKMELDLNDLLEMQHKGENSLEGHKDIRINVPALIALLNRLFVVPR